MKHSITSISLQIIFAVLVQVNVNATASKLDPIKFTLTTTAESIALNEEFEFKITATYQNISPNIAYVFQGANSFKIKVIFPEGFKQTGGTYHDFIGTELSSSQPSVSYIVKGKFTKESEDGSFLLLRGNKNAHSDSEFILVGKIGFTAFKSRLGNKEVREARIAAIVQSYIPYMTIAQFNAGMADTSKVIYINEGKMSGIFIKDPAATTATADTGLVLGNNGVYLGVRFRRKHENIFYPEWWGVSGLGTTNDRIKIQRAITAATSSGGEVVLNGHYLVVGNGTSSLGVNVTCNISGSGTILTKSQGLLNITADSVTIKDITVDGESSSSTPNGASGRGIYATNRTGIVIENVKIRDTYLQGIWFMGCKYPKISACTITNNRGSDGDGIYVKRAVSPIITENICTKFERIGIVCEGGTDGVLPFLPTRNAIISNNVCEDAIESSDYNNSPNAGIWLENVAGAVITGNITNNTFAKGIVVTPSLTEIPDRHEYIINGNKVSNSLTGISCASARNQNIIIANNIVTDTQNAIEIDGFDNASLDNNTFVKRDKPIEYFTSLVRWTPTTVTDAMSNLSITNCVNATGMERIPILIPSVANNAGSLYISDCLGNFAYLLGSQPLRGNSKIRVKNCTLDWSIMASGSYFISNNFVTSLTNCEIKLPTAINLGAQGTELSFNDSRVSASSIARLILYDYGNKTLRINGSDFNNVAFRDVQSDKVELINSRFEGYNATSGLFEPPYVPIDTLNVSGCLFSSSILVTPVQFVNALTFTVGQNIFYSNSLTNATVAPLRQSVSFHLGTSAQRPSVTQAGYLYFDTTLNKEIYWNGSEWVLLTTPPSFVSDPSPTTLTKATLNAKYGTLRAGSIITCENIPGGYEYRKLSDSNTSGWVQTQWSTGNQALAL